MGAVAIYIDPNGSSHIIDDPNAPNPGVPPEALDALKKYKNLCLIHYDAKNTKGFTNDALQKAIDDAIKADTATRQKIKQQDAAKKAIESGPEKTKKDAEKAADDTFTQDEKDADKEFNKEMDRINSPSDTANGPTKDAERKKARDERTRKGAAIAKKRDDAKAAALLAYNNAVGPLIKKLPPAIPPPPPPPVSCEPQDACAGKECNDGLIMPNPGYMPPKKGSDAPPTAPKYKGYIGNKIMEFHTDHLYFCTCDK